MSTLQWLSGWRHRWSRLCCVLWLPSDCLLLTVELPHSSTNNWTTYTSHYTQGHVHIRTRLRFGMSRQNIAAQPRAHLTNNISTACNRLPFYMCVLTVCSDILCKQLYFRSFDSFSFTDLLSYARTVCRLWFFKLWFGDASRQDGEQTPEYVRTAALTL